MFKTFLKNSDLEKIPFSADFLPTVEDRAFWDTFQNDECISIAEKEMDYDWPVIKATDFMAYRLTGERKSMENIHFDRRNHLVLFALAELKENKGRFLPQLVNGLFAICEESFWGVSAHFLDYKNTPPYLPAIEPYIDLFASETAEHIASITAVLKKPLLNFCPAIIERVEYELDRRIKTPYETHNDFWWMGNITPNVNNWNPWILSNVLTVFLLTEKNQKRIASAIGKMFTEVQKYYDTLPSDGGCDEGPLYWTRAGACLFEFVYQLKLASSGKIDLSADEKFVKIGSYYKKAHVSADLFVNVADAHPTGLGVCIPLAFAYGMATENKEFMNFCAHVYSQRTSKGNPLSHENRTFRRLIFCSRSISEMERWNVTHPIHDTVEILPIMQLATVRNGDMILSAKGGHNNESHNHNDVGSFTLYDNTTPVLIDVGIGTYTRDTFDESTRYTKILWTQGKYHNIPTVNGVSQIAGEIYRADKFEVNGEQVCVSFADAYTSKAGISALSRTLRLSENKLTITDEFAFTGEMKAVCETFMSILPVRIENGAAYIGDSYKLTASCGTVKCEKVPFDDEMMIRDWQSDGVYRILLDTDNKALITVTVEKI